MVGYVCLIDRFLLQPLSEEQNHVRVGYEVYNHEYCSFCWFNNVFWPIYFIHLFVLCQVYWITSYLTVYWTNISWSENIL